MKAGAAYEQVVAEVIAALDPSAKVERSGWTSGLDGRRDFDVVVRGHHEGVERCVLIECKDYNPRTTGPVGIGVIDALESKRRDIGVDVALICSNAGFTADALRKARRVGIGAIAVMRQGDGRIRYLVEQEFFFRKLRRTQTQLSLDCSRPESLENETEHTLTFEGLPLVAWVIHRMGTLLAHNPVTSGAFAGRLRFVTPLQLETSRGPVAVEALRLAFSFVGAWFVQRVQIDATAAVYDWIHDSIRIGRGQLTYKNLNFDGGTRIEAPPDSELANFGELRASRDFAITLCLVDGLRDFGPAPALDPLIVPEDLDPVAKDIDQASMNSSTEF